MQGALTTLFSDGILAIEVSSVREFYVLHRKEKKCMMY